MRRGGAKPPVTHARDSLFVFAEPPVHRKASPPPTASAVRAPARRKDARTQDANPLMLLPPQPTPTPPSNGKRRLPTLPLVNQAPIPVPEPTPAPERRLPAWIRNYSRPPLQAVVAYTSPLNHRCRQPIAQFRSLELQDIEVEQEINTILSDGCFDVVLEILVTATGSLVSRHAVSRSDDGSLVYRLIAISSRYETADAQEGT